MQGKQNTRRHGREFGSERPKVIYMALRWNDSEATSDQEQNMVNKVAYKLRVKPTDLRIYNLVEPSAGRGMSLNMEEFDEVEDTINRITDRVIKHKTVHRIVVGGRSGPMPMVALLLAVHIPKTRKIKIEVCNHHKARRKPLKHCKVIRK